MEQVVAMDMDVLVIDEPYAPNKLFLGTIIHRAGCTFVVPLRRFRSTKSCAEYLATITTRIAADSCPIGVYEDRYVDHDGEQRMVVDGAEPQFLWDNR